MSVIRPADLDALRSAVKATREIIAAKRLGSDRGGEPLDTVSALYMAAKRIVEHADVEIMNACPFAPYHGGCHFPICPADCAGRRPKP